MKFTPKAYRLDDTSRKTVENGVILVLHWG